MITSEVLGIRTSTYKFFFGRRDAVQPVTLVFILLCPFSLLLNGSLIVSGLSKDLDCINNSMQFEHLVSTYSELEIN